MKQLKRLCALCLLCGTCAILAAQEMLVGSYNIRYQNDGDSLRGDIWSKRQQVICDQVNFLAPDIFGAQEVLHAQLADLLSGLDDYGYIGVGRDDGQTAGEYAAIFYKKKRLLLLDEGHFWLSETPDRPSLGWDAACIRICTWGKFAPVRPSRGRPDGTPRPRRGEPRGGADRTREPQAFYFFNLHMDHVGTTARREAAKLVVKKIREIAKEAPVILTGDFNVDQTDEIYRIFTTSGLLKDSYESARLRFAENGTFNDWKQNLHTRSRIDHVFVSPQTPVEAYGIMTDSYWTADDQTQPTHKAADAPQQISFSHYTRRNPSDHYPVFVRLGRQP